MIIFLKEMASESNNVYRVYIIVHDSYCVILSQTRSGCVLWIATSVPMMPWAAMIGRTGIHPSLTPSTSASPLANETHHTGMTFKWGSWWRHQMETFSALLSLCVGNPLASSGFPSQRDSNADLWCVFVISLKKLLNKHWFDRQL